MVASDYCTITVTTDTQENANLITQTLLEKNLVACVQSHKVYSTYIWENKTITSEEMHLTLKTKVALFNTIKPIIMKLHTYDVPEVVMYICDDGNADYFAWIEKETIT